MNTIIALLALLWSALVTIGMFVLTLAIIVINFLAVLFSAIYHLIIHLSR